MSNHKNTNGKKLCDVLYLKSGFLNHKLTKVKCILQYQTLMISQKHTVAIPLGDAIIITRTEGFGTHYSKKTWLIEIQFEEGRVVHENTRKSMDVIPPTNTHTNAKFTAWMSEKSSAIWASIKCKDFTFVFNKKETFLKWASALKRACYRDIKDSYVMLETIGRGAFGYVVKAVPKDLYAIRAENYHPTLLENSYAVQTESDDFHVSDEGDHQSDDTPDQDQRDVVHHIRVSSTPSSSLSLDIQPSSSPTGQNLVAIKIVPREAGRSSSSLRIYREMKALNKVNHPGIIKVLDIYDEPKQIYYIMEYMAGGTLMSLLRSRPLKLWEVRHILRQILMAVEWLHRHNIVHRDMKLTNILLRQTEYPFEPKLIDFGLSNFVGATNSSPIVLYSRVGSPHYVSPEVVVGECGYGSAVDCWSLGVIAYTLCFRKLPFKGDSIASVLQEVVHGRVCWNSAAYRSEPHLRPFIQGLLEVDSTKRMSAREALQHPFLNEC